MERLLAKLERRLGWMGIESLPALLVAGTAAVFLLEYIRSPVALMLDFDWSLVKHGQVWRVFTFLLFPMSGFPWVIFELMIDWLVLSSLASQWGAFRLTLFYAVGVIATVAVAATTGAHEGNFYLNSSVFFAFATLFPDYEFRMYFLFPIKVKWLAWIDFAFCVTMAIRGGLAVALPFAAAMASYLLFFSGTIVATLRGQRVQMKQAARRSSMRAPAEDDRREVKRACAICGASEADGADIRVCSCEKCKAAGGSRTLCLEHARNH